MPKIAVVQHPPIFLNKEKSLARALDLIAEAAAVGSDMIIFPETWLPGYPMFIWRLAPGRHKAQTETLYSLSQRNSVDLGRNDLTPVQQAAREHGVVVVMGHQEIDSAFSGSTLYNSVAIIDADGRLLNNHRKLMPTCPERTVWGCGDGSTLKVVETAVGRVGALICWESYMPLARYALYAQNIEIYVAPTWDSGPFWLNAMQHIAREGGCWTVGCATTCNVSDIPEDLPYREELFPDSQEWINPGDAAIYKPFAGLHAGPMSEEKGFLYSDIDLEEVKASRRRFDATGHYARPDVLQLRVNCAPQPPVLFE